MDKPVVIRKAINRSRRTLADARRWIIPDKYPGMRLTPARILNFQLSRLEKSRGAERVRAYPTVLTIEATNVCNLRCPACFTGAGELGRTRSMLDPALFDRVLGELGSRLLQIEFYNWGEPLLNKELPSMIRKAADLGISTIISSNLSIPIDRDRAEEIVASGLHVLGVSVDGATQSVYEQYRVRGNLDLLVANVRAINEAKRRLGSATPRLVYEYHLFAHNLHEVEAARALARELGMDMWLSKGWVAGPDWDTKGEFNDRFDPQAGRCGFLWDHAVIHNDGGVAPCCSVFYAEDDYGSVAAPPRTAGHTSVPLSELRDRTFHEVWNNDRFRASRRMFAAAPEAGARRDLVCHDCPVTELWRRQRAYSAGGNRGRVPWSLAYNDGFNYFFNRRPARSATAADPIAPADISAVPAAGAAAGAAADAAAGTATATA